PLAGATVEVTAGDIGAGNLQVTLDVEGVAAPAGTTFGAHLHVNPCGTDPTASTLGAGPHYQNPSQPQQLERPEIWLDFPRAPPPGRGPAGRTPPVPGRAVRTVGHHPRDVHRSRHGRRRCAPRVHERHLLTLVTEAHAFGVVARRCRLQPPRTTSLCTRAVA